ncbi:MAG: polyprenyl synthetase family protein [Chloroflexota bacterium]
MADIAPMKTVDEAVKVEFTVANAPADFVAPVMAELLPSQKAPPDDMDRSSMLRYLPSMCADALATDGQAITLVSNAWNLYYRAAHLLDAIEDGDTLKDHWANQSNGVTINAAIGMMTSASLMLNRLELLHIDPDVAQAIRAEFDRTVLAMCAGQHRDLTAQYPSLDQCWQIARAKSGTFFGLACRATALAAGASPATVEHLGTFGQHLGLLIQILDDLSDLSPAVGVRSDLQQPHGCTLPMAYAMEVLSDDMREVLERAHADASQDVDAEVTAREIIIQQGALVYLSVEAHRCHHIAVDALEHAVAPSPARTTLRHVLDMFLV